MSQNHGRKLTVLNRPGVTDARDLERGQLYDLLWEMSKFVHMDVLNDLGLRREITVDNAPEPAWVDE